MASAFQPSEGFYAAIQFHPNLNTAGSNFPELHQWCLETFADDTKVVCTNKKGFLKSMMTADKDPVKDKDKIKLILGSLAAGLNGVMGTRSQTPYKSMPDKVYMTGGKWPKEVEKFRLDHYGMEDYNSSDVIMEYGPGKYGSKPTWVGVSLKEKGKEQAANPPLINNAFSNYIKDNQDLVIEIDNHRKKFFAGVIQEACQEGEPLFGLTMPGNGSGKQGKLITSMSLNNMQDVEDIWSAKVAVMKNGKQLMLPLINLKSAVDMINRSGVVENSDNDAIKNVLRKYVNKKLQSDKEINPLFKGFLDIMKKPKVKKGIANSLLNRVLKLDMYNEMGIWEDNEFAFYLVVGVGDYTSTGPSYLGHTQVESLESLLVAIASVSKGKTELRIDEVATKAAAAAKVFFTLYKVLPREGDVGILTVELRYGGNFKGYPRFHANMHKDFLDRIGRAKIELADVLQRT